MKRADLSRQEAVPGLTIVHLGAGRGAELDGYLAAGAKRVVLVEADPLKARELARRTVNLPAVEVVAAAVAPESGTAVLKLYNHPYYSSLRNPTTLSDLYPGLRLQKEVVVQAYTASELLNTLTLTPEEGNWLAIETPGEEAAILKALIANGQLACFQRIVLSCAQDALFEGASGAPELLDLLRGEDYEVGACEEDYYPDLVRFTLERHPAKLENRALRREVGVLTRRLEEQRTLVSRRKAQLADAVAARDEQKRLAKEGQGRIRELIEDRGRLRRKLDELRTRKEDLEAAVEELQRGLARAQTEHRARDAERQAQLEAALRERDQEASLAAERAARVEQLAARVAELEEREVRAGQMTAHLARAEGQLDLVKEWVLREAGV